MAKKGPNNGIKVYSTARYRSFIEDLKQQVRSAQVRASISVNRELVQLYYNIGRRISEHQAKDGWGSSVVERISKDLRHEFPELKGFSPRNLWDMLRFYHSYKDDKVLRQLVAEIPWGHNLVLLNTVKDPAERKWYIIQTRTHGWSRNILVHQIESSLHLRKGKAITNFKKTLPAPQSDLAKESLKDPYIFDFLTVGDDAIERSLEQALLEHIQKFLLELGVGFSFIGRQYHLEIGGEDYYLDLLFYHLKLRSYVVFELKTGPFKPEYAGKMNFYLSAIDELLKDEDDNPSIGAILCKTKNSITAEYALKDLNKPIGVANYQLTKMLPKEFKQNLPSIDELESELAHLGMEPGKARRNRGKKKRTTRK